MTHTIEYCEHIQEAKAHPREPFLYLDILSGGIDSSGRCYMCREAARESNAHLDQVHP